MKSITLALALLFTSVAAHAATINCFYQDQVTQTPHESSDYIQQFTLSGEWDYTTSTLTLHRKEFYLKQVDGKWVADTAKPFNDSDDVTGLKLQVVNNNGENAALAPTEHYADGNYYNPTFTIQSGATVQGATGRFTAFFSVYQQTDDVPYHQKNPMTCTIR